MSVPADISTATPSEIKGYIDTMLNDYTNNGNSFSSGYTGTFIPNFVNQLQKMVRANPATTLQNYNNELFKLDDEIIKAKGDLQIAKDRVSSLRETNKQSYYESWFPINRPLRSSTNVILLGIGIFFFVLTFFMILHTMGFALHLNILWLQPGESDSPILQKLRMLFPFGLGTGLLILGLVILILNIYALK